MYVDLQRSWFAAHLHALWALLQWASDHDSDGLHLHSEKTSCKAVGLFSCIRRSKRQSFNERQWAFGWQIDHSTNGRSLIQILHSNSTCFRCVRHAHYWPAFIWTLALISYWAVKPLAFKRDPVFIQIRRLFKEIQYCFQNSRIYIHNLNRKIIQEVYKSKHKHRYLNHLMSFKHEKYGNRTELSKYIWNLKREKKSSVWVGAF